MSELDDERHGLSDIFQPAEVVEVSIDEKARPHGPSRLRNKLNRRPTVQVAESTSPSSSRDKDLARGSKLFHRAKSHRMGSNGGVSQAETQPRHLVDIIIGPRSTDSSDEHSIRSRKPHSLAALDFIEHKIDKANFAGKRLACIFEAADLKLPNLTPKPFGEQWEEDVFVLYGNSIRQELGSAYEMLFAIQLALSSVEVAVVEDYINWWKVFSKYVSDVQTVYESVIFPWLETVVPLEGCLERESRQATRQKLDKMASEVAKAVNLFLELDASAFAATSQNLSRFTSCLLEFLDSVESGVPPCLQMFFNAESKRDTDIQIREYVVSGRHFEFFFPITLHWLSDENPKHTQFIESILKGKLRFLYPGWLRKAEKYHFALAARVVDAGFGTSSRPPQIGNQLKSMITRHSSTVAPISVGTRESQPGDPSLSAASSMTSS